MPDATPHRAPPLTVEAWIGWLAVVMAVAVPLYHPWIGMAATVWCRSKAVVRSPS